VALAGPRDVALPLLFGHVVYGIILGAGWNRLAGRLAKRAEPGERPAARWTA
jgi:hypothetical protein